MTTGTLTSANSVLMLTVPGLYDTPQQIQGYAADNIFSVGQVSSAETSMGLDGILSSGWIPQIKAMTITLQANSETVPVMEQWVSSQEQARENYGCSLTVSIPALGIAYSCTNGFLTSQTLLPDAGKKLAPRSFVLSFGSIQPQSTS